MILKQKLKIKDNKHSHQEKEYFALPDLLQSMIFFFVISINIQRVSKRWQQTHEMFTNGLNCIVSMK